LKELDLEKEWAGVEEPQIEKPPTPLKQSTSALNSPYKKTFITTTPPKRMKLPLQVSF
jgi:hypothetical protein